MSLLMISRYTITTIWVDQFITIITTIIRCITMAIGTEETITQIVIGAIANLNMVTGMANAITSIVAIMAVIIAIMSDNSEEMKAVLVEDVSAEKIWVEEPVDHASEVLGVEAESEILEEDQVVANMSEEEEGTGEGVEVVVMKSIIH